MIYKHHFTLPEELAADIADQGFEFMPELLRRVRGVMPIASATWLMVHWSHRRSP